MYSIHHGISGIIIPPQPNKQAAMAVAVGLQHRRRTPYVFITDDHGVITDKAAIAQYAQSIGMGWVFD
ncbi:MAG TPA: hypothetical protein VMI30_08820 [Stellaceae bacterium]|nr:hypothetical protein [Stellaceae bacterium]